MKGLVLSEQNVAEKVAYSRTKANRRVLSLTTELTSIRMSREKYNKRWLHLQMSKTSGRNGRQSPSMIDSSASLSIIGCDIASSSTGFNMHEPASTPCNTGMKNRRRNGNILDDKTKGLTEAFLTCDDNSRITTAKKQTLTKNKIKEQIFVTRQSDKSSTSWKICSEHPNNNVSYITFTHYRLFYTLQFRFENHALRNWLCYLDCIRWSPVHRMTSMSNNDKHSEAEIYLQKLGVSD